MKNFRKTWPGLLAALLVVPMLLAGCAGKDKQGLQKYFTFDDLQNGKTFVTWIGCGYDKEVEETFSGAKLVNGTYPSDFVSLVKQGQADAMVLPDTNYYYYQEEMVGVTPIGELEKTVPYAALFPRTDKGKKLSEEYNRFLADSRENGLAKQIKDIWFSPGGSGAKVDLEGLDPSDEHIKFGYAVDEAPHSFRKIDDPAGQEVALVVEFCKEYGYYPEFVSGEIENLITEVTTGRVDIAVAHFDVKNNNNVYYSDPENEEKIFIIVRSEEPKVKFFDKLKRSFERTFIEEDRYKDFLSGAKITLIMTFGSLILGTVLGFALYFLYRDGGKAVRAIMDFIRTIMERIPSLVLLMVFFYVIFAKVGINSVITATICFGILFGLNTWSNLQSSIATVSKAQSEAAFVLGFDKNEAFFKILLPQARTLFLENYKSNIIGTMLESSAAGYIMIEDLTRVGDIVKSRTYEAFLPLISVAIVYLILSTIIISVLDAIEKKTDPRNRTREMILEGIDTTKR